MKSVRIFENYPSFYGKYFPAFRLNTEGHGVPLDWVEMRENMDHKNSECGHFSRRV